MNKMKKWNDRLARLASLLVCIVLIAVVSIRRDGRLLGREIGETAATAVKSQAGDTIRMTADGTYVINTTPLGKDIIGYGGPVPLEITIKEGRVMGVKALRNAETPDFFDQARRLLTRWNGKTVEEAAAMQVDAVSGATFSSKAIIDNMERGLQYAGKATATKKWWEQLDMSWKTLAGLLVALMAAIVPLVYKNKRYRLVQQVLNIVVLGFWCGTFLSYSAIIGFMSNGMNLLALLTPLLMLVMAFIYPLFGKKNHYCNNVCPLGCLQELAGKSVKKNLKISSKTVGRLNRFRQVLWGVLMLCLWTGAWAGWVDYEPFSAFIFRSASWVVIAIAVAFTQLSTVVMRPYCRFVCPLGTLFKVSQTKLFARK